MINGSHGGHMDLVEFFISREPNDWNKEMVREEFG